jgi:hypothetical protein
MRIRWPWRKNKMDEIERRNEWKQNEFINEFSHKVDEGD